MWCLVRGCPQRQGAPSHTPATPANVDLDIQRGAWKLRGPPIGRGRVCLCVRPPAGLRGGGGIVLLVHAAAGPWKPSLLSRCAAMPASQSGCCVHGCRTSRDIYCNQPFGFFVCRYQLAHSLNMPAHFQIQTPWHFCNFQTHSQSFSPRALADYGWRIGSGDAATAKTRDQQRGSSGAKGLAPLLLSPFIPFS